MKIKFIFLIILIISCNKIEVNEMEDILSCVLDLSGNNRHELEKVLMHYKQSPKDSLKLRAAKFLIINMSHHYSLSGDYMSKYIKNVDSLYKDLPSPIKSYIYQIPGMIPECDTFIKKELDIHNITSEFLINNINYSFKLYENCVYTSNLSFEDFCEYILPYRTGNEPLISWKDSSIMNIIEGKNVNEYELITTQLSDYFSQITSRMTHFDINRIRDTLLSKYRYNYYRDNPCIQNNINKSIGLPYAIDFVPNMKNDFDSYNKYFWGININKRFKGDIYSYYSKTALPKIYRKTYALNPIPNDDSNYIPKFFRNPYNRDVTKLYQKTGNIKCYFADATSDTKYAYLTAFNDYTWEEMAWARIKNKKALFKDMSVGVVYIPVYYKKAKRIFGDNPILIKNNGEIKTLSPNLKLLQNIRIKRNYTFNIKNKSYANNIIGVKIVASDDSIYNNFQVISKIIKSNNLGIYDSLSINKKYKYFGIAPNADNMNSNEFAEIKFFDNENNELKGIPYFISKNGGCRRNDVIARYLFDNNLSTSAAVYYIGNYYYCIKFDNSEHIAYIKYLPKNDGNNIYIGDEYELLYFNKGKWMSFEKKIALTSFLDFKNIPTNALFLLKNLTKKEKARPFTVNNDGKIKFW